MYTNKKVTQLIESLSIEEKVGQLFILAYAGQDKDYAFDLIKTMHVGGFYITDDNAHTKKDAAILASQLQQQAALRACNAPLILGVDQEGAWGILTKETDLGPGNLALGIVDDIKITEKMYRVFAQQMKSIGYNTLLSPCADVNSDPDNPIIGQRAFGEEPIHVAKHVAAAVKGISQGDNLSCAKHFPGHGDTHTDTHQALPVVDKSFEQLMSQDLIPFKKAIDANVSMIMTSHIKYPQIDETYPATLSYKILTELLKNQLNFNGLIITDSMNMWAMRKNYLPHESAILALKAGAHLIMLSEEHYENGITDYKEIQKQTINGVIEAVKQNELDINIIDSALSHVLCYKYTNICLNRSKEALSEKVCTQISNFSALQAIKTLKNDAGLWPLKTAHFNITFAANPKAYDNIVNSRGIGPNDPRTARDTILTTLNKSKCHYSHISYGDFQLMLQKESSLDSTAPLIIITEDYPLPGERFDTDAQIKIVNKAIKVWHDKVIVIGMRSDYELEKYPDLKTYICAYSSRIVSAQAVANALIQN